MLDRQTHQFVPRGMKFHLIGPVTESVMRMQHRWILVGLKSPANSLLGTHQPPEILDLRFSPPRPFSLDSTGQNAIGREEIVVHQRRRLVQHLMRGLRRLERQFQNVISDRFYQATKDLVSTGFRGWTR